jgi:hypothetical protein
MLSTVLVRRVEESEGGMAEPHIVASADGSFGEVSLFSNRVVLIRLNEGLNLDADVGRRGIPELEAFIGPGRYVAIVDGRRIGYVPKDGRDMVRQSIGSDRVATGFIVNTDASEWLAGRFLTEAEPIDGTVFTSETAALEWAHQRMAAPHTPAD